MRDDGQGREATAWTVATRAAVVALLALASVSVVLIAVLALAGRPPAPLDVGRWLAAGTGVTWLTTMAAQLRARDALPSRRGRREEALAPLRAS